MELDYYPITKPIRTTQPTIDQEPVSLEEAKRQCGIADSISFNNDELRRLISTAREYVETDTGLICYTGTFTWKVSEWPCENWLEIRALRPVSSITSITYVDGSGATQTWSASNYVLETSTVVPLVRLAYAAVWPGDYRGDVNGITLTLVAGHATVLAIPNRIKQAVLLLVNQLFISKNDDAANAAQGLGTTYESLVNSLRRPTYP